MTLHTNGLRRLPEDFRFSTIRDSAISPLILIRTNGEVSYATGKLDKDALMGRAEAKDLVLFVWGGQWKSDVFEVTVEERTQYLCRA